MRFPFKLGAEYIGLNGSVRIIGFVSWFVLFIFFFVNDFGGYWLAIRYKYNCVPGGLSGQGGLESIFRVNQWKLFDESDFIDVDFVG